MLGRNVKFLGSVLILVSYFTLILTLCDHNPYVQDTYLVNHVYDVRPAPFLMECVATCHAHSRCQSVGFEPQSLECHRHTHNSSSAPGNLVPTPGWIHSDINMWPKSVVGPCSAVTCGLDEECIVFRTMVPVCTMVAANLRSVTAAKAAATPSCPRPPPSVSNANVSDGLHLVGSVRKYTCHHGFLDTSTDVVAANTTCLGNLTWSHASLNCSGPWIRKKIPSARYRSYVQLTHEELKLIYINSSIIFQVKTCNDANFFLGRFQDSGIHTRSTVVIGGNNNTYMWIHGCSGIRIHDLLSCTEYRPLWVMFQGNTISAGKGERVGERELMKCTNSENKVINVSITNYFSGSWLFRKRF